MASLASITGELVAPYGINPAEYESKCKAIMATDALPERKGWLYDTDVIERDKPLLSKTVKETFSRS